MPAPAADWTFELCDANGVGQGKFTQAASRVYSPRVIATHTATVKIPQTEPLYGTVTDGQSRIRVFDSTGTLRMFGPMISRDEEGGPDGLVYATLNFADQAWEFTKRIVNHNPVFPLFEKNTSVDQIAFACLNAANTDRATGIVTGNVTGSFPIRNIQVQLSNLAGVIQQLSALQGSFEWMLRYADVAAPYSGAPTIYLDLATATGADRHATIFLEYNTGRNNVQTYKRTVGIDTACNWIAVYGGANPSIQNSGPIVATAFDSTSMTTNNSRWEDTVTVGDIVDQNMLQDLANAHIAIRKNPRTIVDLTVNPLSNSCPIYGTDYTVGDKFTARCVVGSTTTVNGTARMWGVDISIDDNGVETPTFKMVP